MGCISSNLNGECSIWDSDIEISGCDEDGNCIVEDDPNPIDSCEYYNTDLECSECGTDLNIEDCKC